MNITFDKALKQMVFNALRPSVKNRNCPFCDEPVRAKNFAGACFTITMSHVSYTAASHAL